MSRLAKKLIMLPKDVAFSLENNQAWFKGPKGESHFFVHENILISKQDEAIKVSSKRLQKNTKALLGTFCSLVKNSIEGVKNGFEKKLEIEGIGYKAQAEGDNITLFLGLTHPIKIKAPKGVSAKVEKNVITISGPDKEAVGQFAANIRSKKVPEPYKGKGIRYAGEFIRRKAGKKAVGTA